MLAGPGAISTILLLQGKATDLGQHIALLVCIVLVCLASYAILRVSAHGAQWIGPVAMRVATRLMGLLVTAIAFQFFIDALKQLGLVPG